MMTQPNELERQVIAAALGVRDEFIPALRKLELTAQEPEFTSEESTSGMRTSEIAMYVRPDDDIIDVIE